MKWVLGKFQPLTEILSKFEECIEIETRGRSVEIDVNRCTVSNNAGLCRTILCHTMPHYATLCRTMPHYAGLCRTMLHYATLCHTMPDYATLCRTMPLCHTMPHYAGLCRTMPHYVTLCHTMPHYATLCHTMPDYATLCHTMPHYAILCHTMPHYATLSRTMPHHATLCRSAKISHWSRISKPSANTRLPSRYEKTFQSLDFIFQFMHGSCCIKFKTINFLGRPLRIWTHRSYYSWIKLAFSFIYIVMSTVLRFQGMQTLS